MIRKRERAGRADAIETRRRKILSAAKACASRSGFHATSVAQIAKSAGLSVGQIYRYFDSKEAVIAAVVAERWPGADVIAAWLGAPLIGAEPSSETDLARLDRCFAPEAAALSLEIRAEAARNPRVAAIFREARATELAHTVKLLEDFGGAGRTAADIASRAELLHLLVEGMQVWAVRPSGEPDLVRERVRQLVSQIAA